MTPPSSVPADVRTTPDGQLIITWQDQHVSTYALATLRRDCRCAVCRPGLGNLAELASSRPRAVTWTRYGLLASLYVLGFGWLLLWPSAETVALSGPALVLVSIWLFVTGWRANYQWVRPLAAAHVHFCLLLAVLVETNNWSPRAAWEPFLVLGGIYAAAAGAASWWIYRHPPPVKSEPTWHCRTCNYLLLGLTEDRCPECGTPFDRADLPAAPPPDVQSVPT